MGDENTVLSAPEIRHLLRRTSLGGAISETEVNSLLGQTRGQAADGLLAFKPDKYKPNGRDINKVHDAWIRKMLKTRKQLQERLVLFWHDHFATSDQVVQDPTQMALQNKLLRLHCKGIRRSDGTQGSFKDFVKAINKDPAMMDMLDTKRNSKSSPNENYARELMELFTLGVFDSNGQPNYTQEDVSQVARALTGWRVNDRNEAFFNGGSGDTAGGTVCGSSRTGQHDYAACWVSRGPKVIFKDSGGFGPAGRDFSVNGEGAAEIDTVVDILFEHRDSDNQVTAARYVGRRLFEHFAYANPPISVVDEIISASSFDTQFSVEAFLRVLFCHDQFYACAPAPGDGTQKSVRWPVDYVVGTLRRLRIKPKGTNLELLGGTYSNIRSHLENMGQTLLEPPTVFGWDLEEGWLSSATLLARYRFAADIASAREGGAGSLRTERLIDLGLTDPGDIVDAVTTLLGVDDQLTEDEQLALVTYLGPGPIDLFDYDIRNIKLHGLFALVLQSPAYQVY